MLPLPGANALEDGVEILYGFVVAANHHAVTPLQPPDTAAGADINVMDALGCEFLGATNVVNVVRIAAVNQDVASLQIRHDVGDGLVDHCCRHHQPDRARLLQLARHVLQRRASYRLLLRQLVDASWGIRRRRHSCVLPSSERRTMLAPILPRPTIPSCIANSSPNRIQRPGLLPQRHRGTEISRALRQPRIDKDDTGRKRLEIKNALGVCHEAVMLIRRSWSLISRATDE